MLPIIKTFDDAFDALLGNEGGYTDNPHDPGGATRWGITERVARAHGYTGDMRDFPVDLAKSIAKKSYWDVYQCDQFDINIAFQVFDAAYNGGHVAQWLQESVGVQVDGVIGAQTIAAVRASDPYRVIAYFSACRILYLTSLASEFPTFGRGWMNRVANNLKIGSRP